MRVKNNGTNTDRGRVEITFSYIFLAHSGNVKCLKPSENTTALISQRTLFNNVIRKQETARYNTRVHLKTWYCLGSERQTLDSMTWIF